MPSKYQFDAAYEGRFARILQMVRIDPVLLVGLLLLVIAGLGILYSAGDQSEVLMQKQVVRLSIAFLVMLVVAQIPPHQLYLWTPWVFAVGLVLLLMVLLTGEVGKGAQRWLKIGVRFQPSEMMKLATPLMLAWYLSERPFRPGFAHWSLRQRWSSYPP